MLSPFRFNDLEAKVVPYKLHFKRPSGTSRGVLTDKPTWFLVINEKDKPEVIGIGECGPIRGLSADPWDKIEPTLQTLAADINNYNEWFSNKLDEFPAIKFALETALLDLANGGMRILFKSDFTKGDKSITINGLVWMGTKKFMLEQVKEKIKKGFSCLKMKIGAIDFESELSILKSIRDQFSTETLELRVDANGAFTPDNVMSRLEALSRFNIHSIEQPIKAGQWEAMAKVCLDSPIPIALDEELIGITVNKEELLHSIKPTYVILKPTLVGGFQEADEWIALAKKNQIAWWATSALESNIGLSAIAQWSFTKKSQMPQGLGTGQLYTNNINSPLYLEGERLFYGKGSWDINVSSEK